VVLTVRPDPSALLIVPSSFSRSKIAMISSREIRKRSSLVAFCPEKITKCDARRAPLRSPALTVAPLSHEPLIISHISQAMTLLLTCATIVAWTLGARTLSAALGAASLKAHLALVAETCARSVAPLPKTSRIAANAEPGFPDTRRARRRARRDANAFLVLDMFLTCVVALHTANVCGAVVFADPGVAAALALAWPAAIANWIGRLAS
jgi:hypothetical protein